MPYAHCLPSAISRGENRMENKNERILEVFRFRYACKVFDSSRVVSDADFRTILEAARLSPTSFGFEPWRLLVVQDAELKKKLYPLAWGAQNSLNGASHLCILMARKKVDTVYSSDYVTHIIRDIQKLPEDTAESRRQRLKSFQEDDFDLLGSDRAIFDWACKQTYIVLANMLTTAAFLGIDSCPIEGFNQRAVNRLLTEEGLLDPEHFGVSVMAGFGYRNETPRPKTRQPLDDLVSWK
jgi:nitroreductase